MYCSKTHYRYKLIVSTRNFQSGRSFSFRYFANSYIPIDQEMAVRFERKSHTPGWFEYTGSSLSEQMRHSLPRGTDRTNCQVLQRE